MTNSLVSTPGAGARKSVRTILVAACIVAVADGLAAVALTFFVNGRPPMIVFQYIASGILGPAAFSGSIAIALLGVLLHFLISLFWSAACFLVHQRLSQWVANNFTKGIVYGVSIWLTMNLIVLPLSRVPDSAMDVIGILTGVLALIVAAGLPMAYLFDQHFNKRG